MFPVNPFEMDSEFVICTARSLRFMKGKLIAGTSPHVLVIQIIQVLRMQTELL